MKKIIFSILIFLFILKTNFYSQQKKYSDYLKNLKMKNNLIVNFKVENFSKNNLINFSSGRYEISPEVVHFVEENSLIKKEFYIVEKKLYEKVESEWIRKKENVDIFEILGLEELISQYLGYRFIEKNLLEFYPSPEFLEILFNKVSAEVKDILDKNPTGKIWIDENLDTIKKIEVVLNYTDSLKEKCVLKSSMEIEEIDTPLNISLPEELDKKIYAYINLEYKGCSDAKEVISILNKRKEILNTGGKIYKEGEKIIIRIPLTEKKQMFENIFSSEGILEFRLIWDDEKRLKKALSGEIPKEFEILYKENLNPISGEIYKTFYLVKKKNEISQNLIENVEKRRNKYNNLPQIILKFNEEGREKIKNFTKNNLGKLLSIVMDGKILSLNRIVEPVESGVVIIQDNLSEEEIEKIFVVLSSGKIPCKIEVKN